MDYYCIYNKKNKAILYIGSLYSCKNNESYRDENVVILNLSDVPQDAKHVYASNWE